RTTAQDHDLGFRADLRLVQSCVAAIKVGSFSLELGSTGVHHVETAVDTGIFAVDADLVFGFPGGASNRTISKATSLYFAHLFCGKRPRRKSFFCLNDASETLQEPDVDIRPASDFFGSRAFLQGIADRPDSLRMGFFD